MQDHEELFAFADAPSATPLDDEESREIVTEMVERIVVDGGGISVAWREAYRPLLTSGRAW